MLRFEDTVKQTIQEIIRNVFDDDETAETIFQYLTKISINTPDNASVEVIGTEFNAKHIDSKTEVDVEKGSVKLSKGTFSKIVTAGEHGETVRWGDWVVVCRQDMLNPLNIHYDFNTPEFPKEILIVKAEKVNQRSKS